MGDRKKRCVKAIQIFAVDGGSMGYYGSIVLDGEKFQYPTKALTEVIHSYGILGFVLHYVVKT
jgi:hypothetical protein